MKTLKVALIIFGTYFMILPVRDVLNESTRAYRVEMLEFHLKQNVSNSEEAKYSADWIRDGFVAFTKRNNATLRDHWISAGLGFCIFCAGLYLLRWKPETEENEK